MSGHTPGPWSPEYDDAVKVRAPDGSGLCTINWLRGRYGEHGRIDGNEGEANARLIAAAPELLEALKMCAAVCAGEVMDKNGLIRALEQAKSALAKATGEQS